VLLGGRSQRMSVEVSVIPDPGSVGARSAPSAVVKR
jgi:hypothetical protein